LKQTSIQEAAAHRLVSGLPLICIAWLTAIHVLMVWF